jgi:UPF0176 protein
MKREILLYYKYVAIKNPEKFAAEQRDFCEKHGLKGRIIVAEEGVNGTLEGLSKDTKAYRAFLNKKRGFSKIHWKISQGTEDGSAFPRLSVKVRSEIVSLSLVKSADTDVNPRKVTGKRLSPEKLKAWLDKGDKVTIIDMRNDYEHKVGHFEGSVLPPLKNFRDLPKALPKLSKYKNERVVPVCTGGVRCEKASGYLVKKGFKDVWQLDGGIVSFMEKYPGEHFKGALYVFDGRVTMHFGGPKDGAQREVVGRCDKCGAATEDYADCTNQDCRNQMLCCAECLAVDRAYCSARCKKIVHANPNSRSRSVVK